MSKFQPIPCRPQCFTATLMPNLDQTATATPKQRNAPSGPNPHMPTCQTSLSEENGTPRMSLAHLQPHQTAKIRSQCCVSYPATGDLSQALNPTLSPSTSAPPHQMLPSSSLDRLHRTGLLDVWRPGFPNFITTSLRISRATI